MRRSWPRLLLVLPAAVGLSNCSGELEPYYDLVERFAAAEVRAETRVIDLGTATGRHHLVQGWGPDEVDASGATLVALTGAAAEVRMELLAPRALEIELSCRFRGGQEAYKGAVAVELNGQPLEPLSAGRKLQPRTVSATADLTLQGENRLVLRPSGVSRGAGPQPRLSCHRIALGAAGVSSEASAPMADGGRNFVFLPTGTQLAYPMFLEPQSRWVADRVILRGDGARLELLLETDGGGVRPLHAFERSQHDLKIKTHAQDRVATRLILRATGGPWSGGAGVMIEGGRLEAVLPGAAHAGGDAAPVAQPARTPNVFIYMIDTLRPDRLGCYGYGRPTSPNIDRFAEGASLFVNAIGQSSWTKPSTASLFTGMWPPDHRAIGWRDRLPATIDTLAEVLKAAGYRTAGWVANPNVIRDFGFDQGFDSYHRTLKQPSPTMNGFAFEWLEEHGDEPFFYYLHTIDPHAPYNPPEPFRSRFAPTADDMPTWKPRWKWPPEVLPYLSDLYDGEIAFADDSFGKFVERLRRMGLYDDTLLILISDHGEAFREHDRWRHGDRLFSESLNVPLIIKFPGQTSGLRVEQPVQHMDVMPTVLDALGLPIPDAVDGHSLAAFGGGGTTRPAAGRDLYSHLDLGTGLQISVVDGEWKLIQRNMPAGGVSNELYNWREDRGETRDLAAERPVLTAALAAMIAGRVAGAADAPASEQVAIDAETEAALRALGYLQ